MSNKTTEIAKLKNCFGAAAQRSKEADFDDVQLHAAHGYLLTQFLSPHTNRRPDEWGGDPENRNLRRLGFVTKKLSGDDAAEGQFPIAAVAPGDRNYHGGQWAVNLVDWNEEPYLLTSEADVLAAEAAGDISITRMPDLDFKCPIQP